MVRAMNRRKLLLIFPGVLISLIAGPVNAATGPAIKPVKLCQVIIWRGKKYTAIKSGKTIIWNKGVLLPPTPSANTSTMQNPTPTPTPKKSEKVEPLSTKAEFVIAKSSQVKVGESKIFVASDQRSTSYSFMLTRTDKSLFAFSAVCPHQQSLVEVDGQEAVCKKHYSYFDRVDGHCLNGPALGQALEKYLCEEKNGEIWILQN